MDTKRKKDAVPVSTPDPRNATQDDSKDERVRYSTMDILMTVMVVALIAATAGPRLSKAAAENQLPQMVAGLHAVRSQIERYRIEHDGLLPGQNAPGSQVSADDFIKCMIRMNVAGGRRVAGLPANPFMSGDAAAEVTCVNDAQAAPTGEEGTGWWFNAATGQFLACDSRFHAAY